MAREIILAAWLIGLFGLTVRVAAAPPNKLQAELDEKEAITLKLLADPQTWERLTDGQKSPAREALLDTLDYVERVHLRSAAPLLVPHIGDGWVCPFRCQTYEDAYPVLGALVAIGEPAVPELLNRLAAGASEKRDKGTSSEYDLLIVCIREIYRVGGHGVAAARARIAAEREACPVEQRPLWDRVLKNRHLLDESPQK